VKRFLHQRRTEGEVDPVAEIDEEIVEEVDRVTDIAIIMIVTDVIDDRHHIAVHQELHDPVMILMIVRNLE